MLQVLHIQVAHFENHPKVYLSTFSLPFHCCDSGTLLGELGSKGFSSWNVEALKSMLPLKTDRK